MLRFSVMKRHASPTEEAGEKGGGAVVRSYR
jgi:hypothetical protein